MPNIRTTFAIFRLSLEIHEGNDWASQKIFVDLQSENNQEKKVARMVESVDTKDLNSFGQQWLCGFKSRFGYLLRHLCGSSSVGRALASQAKGHEFEPRLPLSLLRKRVV